MFKKIILLFSILIFTSCYSIVSKQNKSYIKDFKVKSNIKVLELQWELSKNRKIKTIEIYKREIGFKKFVKIKSMKKSEKTCKIKLVPLCENEIKIVLKDKKNKLIDEKILRGYIRLERVILDRVGDHYIRVYLPKSYSMSNKRYPSLYLGDGHIMYDIKEDPANGWKIDKTVDSLIEKGEIEDIIMIGLVGNESRFVNIEKVIDEIIPYVDSKYRTIDNREKRGILGSSAGASYSINALVDYPKIFTMAGLLSYPSTYKIKEMGKIEGVKIWIDGGTKEPVYIPNNRGKIKILEGKGYVYGKEIMLYEHKGAYHMPSYWGERVENVLKYFYSKKKMREKGLKLEFNKVRERGIKYYISPIIVMDNKMEYSVQNKAIYNLKSNTARIDKNGEIFFGDEKELEITVQYNGFEEKIKIEKTDDKSLDYEIFIYKDKGRVMVSGVELRELGDGLYIELNSAKKIAKELKYKWNGDIKYLFEASKKYIKLKDMESKIMNNEFIFYMNISEKNLIKREKFAEIFLKVYSNSYYEGEVYILKDKRKFLNEIEELCLFKFSNNEYKDLMDLEKEIEFISVLSKILRKNSYFIIKTPIANNSYELIMNYFSFENEKVNLNGKIVNEFMGEKIYESLAYKEYITNKNKASYKKFKVFFKELLKEGFYYNEYELNYDDMSSFQGDLSGLRKQALKGKNMILMENMTIIGKMK